MAFIVSARSYESQMPGDTVSIDMTNFLTATTSRLLNSRFAKYGMVGAMGMVFNLVILGCLVRFIGLADWRASVIASMFSMLHNYIWNNNWTFADQGRQGRRLLIGFFSYAGACFIGMCLSAYLYSLATTLLLAGHQFPKDLRIFLLMSIQFFSVCTGAYLNYCINKKLTWPSDQQQNRATAPATGLRISATYVAPNR